MTDWDESYDFVVMGSGAAAMSAAIRAHDLGLSVLVLEKTDLFGGNTAMSGGVCWIANNPGMKSVGIEDSDEEGLEYLKHITDGQVPTNKLKTYIDQSKRMLAYMHEHTHMRYVPLPKYTDYYPEAPGGKPGGRSMDPIPFDGAKLGPDLLRLRPPHLQSQILGKFGITAREAHAALGVGLKTMLFMAWQMFLYGLRYFKRKKWGRDTKLCAGNSLTGRLLASLRERNVDMWLNAPVTALRTENGRVCGVRVERDKKPVHIEARHGVMLGAGGFSRNLQMRQKYQREPITTEWTAGSPANMGDGIAIGQEAGGVVDLMKEAWWTPTALVPKSDYAWVLVVEKSLPHGVFVNQDGKRFTNEAAPYVDVVIGMYDDAQKAASPDPRWFHVFDASYRRSSVTGPVAPGKVMPDSQIPRRYRDGKYMHKAQTLQALASKIGLPADALEASIARFNEHAVLGEDPDFNRGWSAQDRYYGDPRVKPNAALGPVETAPFYAVQIYPGDLGTKGGLVTDNDGRVLDASGAPIAGLYAAGNNSASMMGRTYPGAGGTIGPALTFGFLAAEAAANYSIETGSTSNVARDGDTPASIAAAS